MVVEKEDYNTDRLTVGIKKPKMSESSSRILEKWVVILLLWHPVQWISHDFKVIADNFIYIKERVTTMSIALANIRVTRLVMRY